MTKADAHNAAKEQNGMYRNTVLLLVAKSVGSQGSFSKITSIQRVNTVGGVEPKTAFLQSTVGTTARGPYTADDYFLTEK
jgi:hypothetical protein